MREIFAKGSAACADIYQYFKHARTMFGENLSIVLISVFFYDICLEYIALFNVGKFFKTDTAFVTLSNFHYIVFKAL